MVHSELEGSQTIFPKHIALRQLYFRHILLLFWLPGGTPLPQDSAAIQSNKSHHLGEGTFMFRVIPWDRARMQSVCSDISMFGEHLFHSVFCTVLSTKGNSSQQGSLDVSVI